MSRYRLAKYEKGTHKLIGLLSSGKRQWLPENSEHLYWQGSDEDKHEVQDIANRKDYRWYYLFVPISSQP